MTDTAWHTSLSASDLLSDSRTDINNNFAAARKLTSAAIAFADSPYTAASQDIILADATGGAITVNLPAVASSTGQVYCVKKLDVSGNAVTLDGTTAETIDGATTKALSGQYDSVTVYCDGSEWHIIGEST